MKNVGYYRNACRHVGSYDGSGMQVDWKTGEVHELFQRYSGHFEHRSGEEVLPFR